MAIKSSIIDHRQMRVNTVYSKYNCNYFEPSFPCCLALVKYEYLIIILRM